MSPRRRFALGPVLLAVAAAGCGGATVSDGVADPHRHPDDPPTRDRFRPDRVAIAGAFAYDPAARAAVDWTDRGVAREPSITLRFTDARFDGRDEGAWRCRVALEPYPGRLSVRVVPFEFSFDGTEPSIAYAHLMVGFEASSFDVVDAPYEAVDGSRVPGCGEVEDDPDRGISMRYDGGDLRSWIGAHRWSIGIGDLAPTILDDLASEPPGSALPDLLARGLLAGGSAGIEEGTTSLRAPINVALATAIGAEGDVLYEGGGPVRLPASGFDDLDTQAAPAAVIEVYARYGVALE